MKLLMVTHYFDSHSGGIERVARELFHRLAEPECHVTWAAANISAPPADSEYGGTLPLTAWNGLEKTMGLPLPLPSPISLARLWSAVAASDVVLLHDCLYLSNIAAFAFARLHRIPIVIVQHIGTIPYANPALALLMKLGSALITRPMLRAAGQVAFISEVTQSHFSQLRFARPPVLLFNGVNTEIFYPSPDNVAKAALRAHLGLPTQKPVVLFVGRFVEKKGLPIMKKMAQSAPEMTWAFAGSGPLHPGDWGLEQVKTYSNLSGKSLADLYRAADVFVLPSTGEGFPLVIQEALACGLPIVCSAETATADAALAPFVRGVALTSGNDERPAENFLLATREAVNWPASRDIAARSHAFVRGRYSWSRVADRYYEIVSRLAFGRDFAPRKSVGESHSSSSETIEQERSRP
jgi:glycosyltransferase involved in cell wall biosynthesis